MESRNGRLWLICSWSARITPVGFGRSAALTATSLCPYPRGSAAKPPDRPTGVSPKQHADKFSAQLPSGNCLHMASPPPHGDSAMRLLVTGGSFTRLRSDRGTLHRQQARHAQQWSHLHRRMTGAGPRPRGKRPACGRSPEGSRQPPSCPARSTRRRRAIRRASSTARIRSRSMPPVASSTSAITDELTTCRSYSGRTLVCSTAQRGIHAGTLHSLRPEGCQLPPGRVRRPSHPRAPFLLTRAEFSSILATRTVAPTPSFGPSHTARRRSRAPVAAPRAPADLGPRRARPVSKLYIQYGRPDGRYAGSYRIFHSVL